MEPKNECTNIMLSLLYIYIPTTNVELIKSILRVVRSDTSRLEMSM